MSGKVDIKIDWIAYGDREGQNLQWEWWQLVYDGVRNMLGENLLSHEEK